jgi:hypothetical protein
LTLAILVAWAAVAVAVGTDGLNHSVGSDHMQIGLVKGLNPQVPSQFYLAIL